MLGATVRVKYRHWGDPLRCSSGMVSGGQGRFPGGSGLLNQDLTHKEDLVGKEGEESIPCIKTALQKIRREGYLRNHKLFF